MRRPQVGRVRRGVVSIALTSLLLASFSGVSGAANSKAVVTGSLRMFGGTANSPLAGTPVAGRVVFKPTRGVARALKIGKSGEFTISLAAGTYKAFGGPPAWGNECLANGGKPFKVDAGHKLHVVVACIAY